MAKGLSGITTGSAKLANAARIVQVYEQLRIAALCNGGFSPDNKALVCPEITERICVFPWQKVTWGGKSIRRY